MKRKKGKGKYRSKEEELKRNGERRRRKEKREAQRKRRKQRRGEMRKRVEVREKKCRGIKMKVEVKRREGKEGKNRG